MSFKNTKVPSISDIKKKAKYPLPMREKKCGRGKVMEYYFTPELESEFRRLFPIKTNLQIMELFGIGFSTLQRFKRRLGLKKNMKKVKYIQYKHIKKTCTDNGYYDSLRGVAPSKECIEGTKKFRKENGHPLLRLKKQNPRKYKCTMKKWSEIRTERYKKERRRVEHCLHQETNLHVPYQPYTVSQKNYRSRMKTLGYILGDMRDRFLERFNIYYDIDTDRHIKIENGAISHGMNVLPLPND